METRHAVGCRCEASADGRMLFLSPPCAALAQPTRLEIATKLLAGNPHSALRAEGVEDEWQREMCRSTLRLADVLIAEAAKK